MLPNVLTSDNQLPESSRQVPPLSRDGPSTCWREVFLSELELVVQREARLL